MVVAAVLLGTWTVWLVALARTSWNPGTVATLTIGLAGLDLVIRPTEFALGLDRPFPDGFIVDGAWSGPLVTVQLAAIVWIVALLVGRSIVAPFGPVRRWGVSLPDRDRAGWLAVLMGALAVVVTVPLWLRFGPTGLAVAAKSHVVDVPRVLRFPAVGAAYVGAALTADRLLRRRRGERTASPWTPAVAYVVGAAVSFSWGARDSAILALVAIPAVAFTGDRRLTSATLQRGMRQLPMVVLGIALVLGLGFGLRAVRDQTLAGRSLVADQDTALRQLAVATNHTRYDAFLLTVADTVDLESPGLGLAADAAIATVPIVGGAEVEFPGVTVAQAHVPTRVNGWPLTAPGDWWFMGGLVGVMIGGLLSGIAVGVADRVLAGLDPSRRVVGLAFAVLWVTTVASSGGLSVDTPARFRSLLLLPLLLLVVLHRFVPTVARRGPTDRRRPALAGDLR